MANHGYCKRCFWYKITEGRYWKVIGDGLQEFPSKGRCYMQNGDGVPYKEVKGNDYCRDYYNRKRTKEKLEEYIKKLETENN